MKKFFTSESVTEGHPDKSVTKFLMQVLTNFCKRPYGKSRLVENNDINRSYYDCW